MAGFVSAERQVHISQHGMPACHIGNRRVSALRQDGCQPEQGNAGVPVHLLAVSLMGNLAM